MPRLRPMLNNFGTLVPQTSKSQLYPHERQNQRCRDCVPEARDQNGMRISHPFIGDEGIGPQAGKPNMGREDDDDDNCVGFRRFSGVTNQPSEHFYGRGRQSQARQNVLQVGELCGVIPKYGPPKRDPVAAAMSDPVQHPLNDSTLSIWRDAIACTCGGGADLGPLKAVKWEGRSWQSGGTEMYCNAHG